MDGRVVVSRVSKHRRDEGEQRQLQQRTAKGADTRKFGMPGERRQGRKSGTGRRSDRRTLQSLQCLAGT